MDQPTSRQDVMAPCGADKLGNSGDGSLERFAGDQHRVHHDRKFAGNGNRNAVEAQPRTRRSRLHEVDWP